MLTIIYKESLNSFNTYFENLFLKNVIEKLLQCVKNIYYIYMGTPSQKITEHNFYIFSLATIDIINAIRKSKTRGGNKPIRKSRYNRSVQSKRKKQRGGMFALSALGITSVLTAIASFTTPLTNPLSSSLLSAFILTSNDLITSSEMPSIGNPIADYNRLTRTLLLPAPSTAAPSRMSLPRLEDIRIDPRFLEASSMQTASQMTPSLVGTQGAMVDSQTSIYEKLIEATRRGDDRPSLLARTTLRIRQLWRKMYQVSTGLISGENIPAVMSWLSSQPETVEIMRDFSEWDVRNASRPPHEQQFLEFVKRHGITPTGVEYPHLTRGSLPPSEYRKVEDISQRVSYRQTAEAVPYRGSITSVELELLPLHVSFPQETLIDRYNNILYANIIRSLSKSDPSIIDALAFLGTCAALIKFSQQSQQYGTCQTNINIENSSRLYRQISANIGSARDRNAAHANAVLNGAVDNYIHGRDEMEAIEILSGIREREEIAEASDILRSMRGRGGKKHTRRHRKPKRHSNKKN